MEPTTAFTVKLRGAPFNVKEVSAVKTLHSAQKEQTVLYIQMYVSVFVS